MGYTDELLRQSDLKYATTWAGVTSAEEIAASTLADALSTAVVDGPHAFLFPLTILSTIGREVVLYGESVWEYRRGRLHWLMQADERVEPGIMRFARNIDWQTGRGMSSLQCAPRLKRTLEGIEKQFEQESQIMAGYMVPVPQSGQRPPVEEGEEPKPSPLERLLKAFASLRVKQSLVEGEMATGVSNYQPTGNYEQKRWGIDTPQNAINLFDKIVMTTLTAIGVPGPIVFPADANSQRESWRIYLSKTVESTARIIELEASSHGMEIALSFPELKSSDIAARARAFVSLVKDGQMTLEQAATVSGIFAELPNAQN